MPGIAGIINKRSAQTNESTLQLMVGAMRYEDFYSIGKETISIKSKISKEVR